VQESAAEIVEAFLMIILLIAEMNVGKMEELTFHSRPQTTEDGR
jgi:hypothetical protein